MSILKVSMEQYQKHHHDTEMLRNSAQKLGVVEIESQFDLEQVRNMLKSRFADMICYSRLSNDWCFIDCKIYRYPITSPILLQTNIVLTVYRISYRFQSLLQQLVPPSTFSASIVLRSIYTIFVILPLMNCTFWIRTRVVLRWGCRNPLKLPKVWNPLPPWTICQSIIL